MRPKKVPDRCKSKKSKHPPVGSDGHPCLCRGAAKSLDVSHCLFRCHQTNSHPSSLSHWPSIRRSPFVGLLCRQNNKQSKLHFVVFEFTTLRCRLRYRRVLRHQRRTVNDDWRGLWNRNSGQTPHDAPVPVHRSARYCEQ